MELTLVRKFNGADCTIGELFVDGHFECFTLEDVVRPGDIARVKVAGKTAIPPGTYEVRLTMSGRFKRVLPLLVNVPSFEGIRIHAGNTAADTEGCILVGRERESNAIRGSRAALEPLLLKLQTAGGPISITIRGALGIASPPPQAP